MNKSFLFSIMFSIIIGIFLINISGAFTLTINSYNYYQNYYWANEGLSSTSSSSGWSAGVYTNSYSASSCLDLSSPLTWNWGDGTQSTFSVDTASLTGCTNLNQYTGSFSINGNSYDNFNSCSISQYDSGGNGNSQTYFTASINGNGDCVFQETHDYTSTGIYSVDATGASPTSGGTYTSNSLSIVSISVSTPSQPSLEYASVDAGSTVTASGSFSCGSSTICANVYLYGTTLSDTSSPSSISASQVYANSGTYSPSINIYNPASGSIVYGNPAFLIVYPRLAKPSITFSQSPSASNGFVTSVQMTATITIPKQTITQGYTEPAPSGTFTWGNGDTTPLSSSSFSTSGSNWVATITNTYSSPNTYPVSVTLYSYLYTLYGSAYGSTSSASTSVTINAYEYPSVSISPPSANVCNGAVSGIYNEYPGTYDFSITQGSYPASSLYIEWGGSDNSYTQYSLASSETHTYTYSGSKTINAYAVDSRGVSGSTASASIDVNSFSKPTVTVNSQSATATQSQSFSASVTKGTCPLNTLTWNWGDGSSTPQSISGGGSGTYTASHTYAMNSKSGSGSETNTYTLSDSITDNMGNSGSGSATISVNYVYPSVGSISPTSTYDTPSGSSYTTKFYTTLTQGTNALQTLDWNFGNGNTPSNSAYGGSNSQDNAYSSAGTYTATAEAIDTYGYYSTTSTSISVSAYPMPSIGNIYETNPNNGTVTNNIYTNVNFNYNVNVTQGGFALGNIVWFNDGNPITSVQAVAGTNTYEYKISSAGTYTISADVSDVNGASVSTSTSVVVTTYYPPIVSNFIIYPTTNLNPQTENGQVNIVNGISTQFSVNLTQGDYPIVQLSWNFGDGNTVIINSTTTPSLNANGINYISHTYAQAGSYTVQISATDSNGQSGSNSSTITVSPYTNPSISGFTPTQVIYNKSITYGVNLGEGSFPISSVIFSFNGANVSVSVPPTLGGVANVQYDFTTAGSFPVVVYATDIYGNTTSEQYSVYAQQLPIISYFNYETYNGNLYSKVNTTFQVNVTAGSNPLSNLTFHFGDGSTPEFLNLGNVSSISLDINHTYSSGTYVAYFTITDSNNNTETSQAITLTVNPYVTPQVINITPTSVYDVVSNNFYFNVTNGSFPLSYIEVNWGDNSSIENVTTNSSTYISHAYPLAPTTNYTIIAYAVDVNNYETAFGQNIITSYQLPVINSVSPTSTYATVPTSFIFNLTKGTFPLSTIQVNFGNGNTVSQAITNQTEAVVNNTYATAGTYQLSASAIDVNAQPSAQFTQTITVNPYVPPTISQLTPTSVTAGLNVTYNFTAQAGTFPLANLTIDWGDGQIINYTNISNGLNSIQFMYLSNNSFTVTEKQYDTFGVYSLNTTLITALAAPFSFTTPEPTINYTISNSTPSSKYVQLNITFLGNATLPVNYTVQSDNFINSYVCQPSISNGGLFGIFCSLNPDAISYPPETLYATVYVTDTAGITKALTEKINVNTVITPPPIAEPFNRNITVSTPYITTQYSPISLYVVMFILGLVIFIGSLTFLILGR